MNISIITVFSDIYTSFLQTSLIKKASEKGLVHFDVTSYFSFVGPKERIDAPTFGHGAGMLIKPEVVQKAIESQEHTKGKAFKVFFSPQGKKLDQRYLQELAHKIKEHDHLMLVCARYEGMDARVEQVYADEIVSVGDFVVMGADVPAMLFLEGLLRYIPGVVGKQESIIHDSFSGPFVDHPEYTEPVTWQGIEVPEVIRSGNHGAIQKWQDGQAAQKTVVEHFDWFRSSTMTEDQKKLGASYIPPHYVALMHTDVVIKDHGKEIKEGTTSVTSIDIHDIARSARTYGLERYFIVTELVDQQKVVQKLLDFWKTGAGPEYNPERFEAVRSAYLTSSLEEVKQQIKELEGKDPLVIATSARDVRHPHKITYHDQAKVWALDRPVLLILGTGRGLTDRLVQSCDFILEPVEGFSDFNHLSVRSAAAVIFDRWLGWNRRVQ